MKPEYIEIKCPMTLDVWKDGSSPSREVNELQKLLNFIPKQGEIYTRPGASLFVHTAQIDLTVVPFPESGMTTIDTADDSRCRLVFKFDTQATIGTNSVVTPTGTNPYGTPHNTVKGSGTATVQPPDTNWMQGTGCLYISNQSADNIYCGEPENLFGMTVPTSPSSDWMPGNVYTDTNVGMFTCWVYVSSNYAYENEFIAVGSNTTDKYTFLARFYRSFSGVMSFQSLWTDTNNGTLFTFPPNVHCAELDKWYFCAFWADTNNHNAGQYIYDNVTGLEQYSVTVTGIGTANFYKASGAFTVGGKRAWDPTETAWNAASGGLLGRLDYLTYWDRIPNTPTSVITLARRIRDLHKTGP